MCQAYILHSAMLCEMSWTEHQSARMSKIKNGGLDHALNRSSSSNLEQLALKGLTLICQKLRRHVTLTTHTWRQFVITGLYSEPVEKPAYTAVGKQGASQSHICIWGASNSLAPALVKSITVGSHVHVPTAFPTWTRLAHQSLCILALGAFIRTNRRDIVMMFVCLSVWDERALWSYGAR